MSKAIIINNPSGITLKTKNKYMDDDVAISLSEAENILASNIKKDVSILGVSGTYEGFVPSGSVTISENGTYNISAFAEATVSVPGLVPSGTLEISSNGVYDVGTYASANVNVSGDFPYADFDILIGKNGSIYSGYCPSVIGEAVFNNMSSMTNFIPYFSSAWSEIKVLSYAFSNCYNLSNVNFLSSSATKIISAYAFLNCQSLSVELVNAVFVDTYAFQNAAITRININTPQSVNFYAGAFSSASYLSSVDINCSHIKLYTATFSSCSSLETFNVIAEQIDLSSANFAFYRTGLLSISLKNILSIVPSYCFASCSNLSMVTLERVVNQPSIRIWANAFSGCSFLKNINLIGTSTQTFVFQLSRAAFQNCYALEKFNVINNGSCSEPYSVIVYLQSSTFVNCSSLLSFEYPTNSPIPSSCFQNCTSLKFYKNNFNLVFEVLTNTFQNCYNLSYFYVKNLRNVFPNAFQNCSSLKSMVLITESWYYHNIYNNAFDGCISLESLYVLGEQNIAILSGTLSNTPIADSSYLGYYGSIYVRASLLSSYQTATNWVQYSDRMVGVTDEEIENIIQSFENVSYIEE